MMMNMSRLVQALMAIAVLMQNAVVRAGGYGYGQIFIGPSQWKLFPTSLPQNLVASVGDTIVFSWTGNHNVYIHPTGNCTEDGAILVGDNTAFYGSYTFTEDDAGQEIYFACDVGTHCEEGGMYLTVMVMGTSPTQTIVDIAVDDPDNFSTLVAALQAADLVDTLASAGPFSKLTERKWGFCYFEYENPLSHLVLRFSVQLFLPPQMMPLPLSLLVPWIIFLPTLTF